MAVMLSAESALARLIEGNRRFAAGTPRAPILELAGAERRTELASGQKPTAIVLGCADSRVPVEVVFDQGPGELFVVRVAGNIVTPATVGSIEFAVHAFACPLVVVLGHSQCGAVTATVDWIMGGNAPQSPNLRGIVDIIRLGIEATPGTDERNASGVRNIVNHRDRTVAQAVRSNTVGMAARLAESSRLIRGRIDSGNLRIVAAVYSLERGIVEFLDTLKIRAVRPKAR